MTEHLLLRVAALELNISAGDPEANRIAARSMLLGLEAGVDIAVLPELFNTGFFHDAESLGRLAEPIDGPSMTMLRGIAAGHDMAIAGSFAARDGGKAFNRAFFIKPSGETIFYDKRHLFSLSSECEVFSAGQSLPPVVEFRGWNVAVMVCYDLRFPVWSRNVDNRYDMMLVPANWPTAREYAWKHLLIARAIENQAVYVGVDRGGSDEFGTYDGLSMICDALGQPVGHPSGQPGVTLAEVSLEDVCKVRRRMPVIDSADDFMIL